MAWAADLISNEKREDGSVYWVIVFNDGNQKIAKEFKNSSQSASDLAKVFIAQLSIIDNALKEPLGPINLA